MDFHLVHNWKGKVKIGGKYLGKEKIFIAGPCSIESREQAMIIAKEVKKSGASAFRGGVFKPRTSPYSFQGLGKAGLKILADVREKTGLPIVTEVMDTRDVKLVSECADVLQIGARNMQNFSLLKEAGKSDSAILLKRGLSATIEEWLLSAEYILKEGNCNVILCERGIRTFEKYTRNTFDVSAIAVAKTLTKLPVIGDPSHAAGRKDIIIPLSKAALAAGADGLMIEVHNDPENALSDKEQALTPQDFAWLMKEVKG
ncbi:MAG: 3-deoxy-7-phosphoheptulonate synthase [Candidatus Aenigmarchaeota archaeon]|nr:3-deoxy-7-phosphoheptulonate synthase [Candidatus Aenigmarchaeota archaeon]